MNNTFLRLNHSIVLDGQIFFFVCLKGWWTSQNSMERLYFEAVRSWIRGPTIYLSVSCFNEFFFTELSVKFDNTAAYYFLIRK